MPIPTDPAAATGLPSDTRGEVLAFLRTAAAAAPDREPPRRSANIQVATDEFSEVQAMVGLASLAAEGLPAPHAGEFGVILELIHSKLGAALAVLSGAGRSAAATREA